MSTLNDAQRFADWRRKSRSLLTADERRTTADLGVRQGDSAHGAPLIHYHSRNGIELSCEKKVYDNINVSAQTRSTLMGGKARRRVYVGWRSFPFVMAPGPQKIDPVFFLYCRQKSTEGGTPALKIEAGTEVISPVGSRLGCLCHSVKVPAVSSWDLAAAH